MTSRMRTGTSAAPDIPAQVVRKAFLDFGLQSCVLLLRMVGSGYRDEGGQRFLEMKI